MQSSIIVNEDVCQKCRTLLNACLDFSSNLQVSADGGCRGCQIIWLQMSCDRISDYDMLAIKKATCTLSKYTSSRFGYRMPLRKTYILHPSRQTFLIKLLSKKTSYQEIPPILRLASENIDNEIGMLMQTTIRWIDNCSQNHEKCQRIQSLKETSNIVPTRLIDVQFSDKGTAKLVDTKELPSDIKPTYLILSYCWGMGNQKAKTTRSNLRQRKHQIMICDLPKTIRDAIRVTRAMGLQYLWVDALCIIQSDNDNFLDDWNTEAAQMGSYYSNALFCISALCTSDSSDGFLRERHSARYPWRKEECIQYEENFFSITPSEGLSNIRIKDMPLMERAWALQERILSTRRLHWSGIGMLWECDSGLFQENQPLRNLRWQPHRTQISERSDYDPGIELTERNDNFVRQILSLPKEEALGSAWLGIVTQYSDMKLTQPTDRLAAIHGVARHLSLQHNVEYFGGIFKGFYSRTLTWQCEKVGHEEDGLIRKDFPSWSWASATSFGYGYRYLSRTSSSSIKDFVRYANPEQSISLDEIIDFRDRSKRKLLLKAPLVSLRLRPNSTVEPNTSASYYELNETIEGPIWRGEEIYCRMDCYVKSPEPSAVTLLICNGDIREGVRTALDSAVCYEGLVLRRSEEDGPNAFVRLGSFEIDIPWSEEEEESNYLNEWETDICLF
ncbi:heterokaryon incompatibility domain-containing protein [Trichoderma sp. SZMC 28012]